MTTRAAVTPLWNLLICCLLALGTGACSTPPSASGGKATSDVEVPGDALTSTDASLADQVGADTAADTADEPPDAQANDAQPDVADQAQADGDSTSVSTDAAETGPDTAQIGTDAADNGPDTPQDAAADAEPDAEADAASDTAQPGDTAQPTDTAPVDDVATDAPDGADAADASTPTTAPSGQPCLSSADCGSGQVCDTAKLLCVACLASSDCGPGQQCLLGACWTTPTCKSDLACKATDQVCDKAAGVCVACVGPEDCGSGYACLQHTCVVAAPCKTSKDCKGVCDTGKQVCVDCTADDDCDAGQWCNALGICQVALCKPGSTVCIGSHALTCAGSGGGYGAKECDDGSVCTSGDTCQGGVCQAGSAVSCDDGNPCTADTCGNPGGCSHSPAQGPCDDGSVCTSGDACSGGSCSGTPIPCNDQNPCTQDTCGPSGCVFLPNALPCSDGSACTSGDACTGGACKGSAVVCTDGNPCTDDSCDAALGCVSAPNTAACDDGNVCTVADVCSGGSCTGKPATCDDGNACTTVDACTASGCAGSGSLACSDGNLCTTDSCDPKQGCVFAANSDACNDGSACTSSDACSNGACKGKPAVCSDGNPCTDDACNPGSGCTFAANTAACDDGNSCTSGDLCGGGTCKGKALVCSDGNPCTDDSCSPANGCVATANSAPCDDGSACTSGDVCASGACSGGPKITCDDGNACTANSCDAKKGCLFTLTSDPCDDGNACTTGDVCSLGAKCIGAAKDCGDGDACTVDSCSGGACKHVAVVCDDGQTCTADTCVAGQCVYAPIAGCGPTCSYCPGSVCLPLASAGGGNTFYDKKGTTEGFYGVFATPAGGWVALGTVDGPFFSALDSKLAMAWSTPWPVGFAPRAAVAMSSGSYALAGDDDKTLKVQVTDPDGKPLGPFYLAGKSYPLGHTLVRAMPLANDGLLLVAAATVAGPLLKGHVVELAADGSPTVDALLTGIYPVAAAPRSDGGVNVVGSAIGTGDLVWAHVDGQGNLVEKLTFGTAADDNPQAGLGHGDGSTLLVAQQAQLPQTYDLYWLDAQGAISAKVLAVPLGATPWLRGLREAANGDLLLAGGAPSLAGWASRITPQGKVLWSRTFGVPGQDTGEYYDLVESGTGYLLAGTRKGTGTINQDLALTRINALGLVDCPCLADKDCDDGNICTQDSCNLDTCKHVAGGYCDDGDACTANDGCFTGACIGVPIKCNDNKPCTADSCDKVKGCIFAPFTGVCDDGNPCSVSDSCSGSGVCAGVAKDCSDGNACTTDACSNGFCLHSPAAGTCDGSAACSSCLAGQCLATNSPKGWSAIVGTGGQDYLDDVVQTSQGWVAVGTTTGSGAGGQDAWFVGLDSSGQQLWSMTQGTAEADSIFRLVANGSGWLALGMSWTGAGAAHQDGWVVTLGSDGKPTGSKLWPAATANALYGAAPLSDGLALVGYQAVNGAAQGRAIRLDAGGNKAWDKTYPQVSNFFVVYPMPGGDLVAYGSGTGSYLDRIVRVRVASDGGVVDVKDFGITGQNVFFDAVPTGDGGTWLAAGNYGNTQGALLLWRIDAAGSATASTTYEMGNGHLFNYGHLTALPDGAFFAATMQNGLAPMTGEVVRADASGKVSWSTSFDSAQGAGLNRGRVDGDGYLVVGFNTGGGLGGSDGWVIHLNTFGLWACPCQSDAGCDDGNPCTADTCTTGVCGHKALVSGSPCPGGTCNSSGSCIKVVCGDGLCQAGETTTNCPADCKTSAVCGDGLCQAGETAVNCPYDCKVQHYCDTHCGGSGVGCYCDASCKVYGDCCTVAGNSKAGTACYGSVCGACAPPSECDTHCGGQAPSGCWCDSGCKTAGDCCTGGTYCSNSTCGYCK